MGWRWRRERTKTFGEDLKRLSEDRGHSAEGSPQAARCGSVHLLNRAVVFVLELQESHAVQAIPLGLHDVDDVL